MAKSKRHHYIPQFFLRGFTNEAGEYFIYDKIKDEIRKSKPINTFFENKRNTGRLGNTEDDFLENLYARFDTRTAPFIEELRKMTSTNYTLHPETLARLKMFIPQLFWRIPKNDENLERIIDSIPFEATGFKIVNHEGKPVSHDIQSKLKDVDYFRKMYHILIPFITHNNIYRNNEYDTWKVYFRENKSILGDNPIITKALTDFGCLTREIIFPVCSDKFLIHTRQPKPLNLPPLFIFELDLLMIIQAKRFVCCADEKYLNTLINRFYPIFNTPDMALEMRKSLFSHFQ